VFDATFKTATLAGSFSDPNIPAGFAPFNVANIGGQLYVTYAKQDDDKEDDVAGPGNGYIDIFDTAGTLVRRFASQGTLNSPWAVAVAPSGFGPFGGALLIGNFGDGRINAYDPNTGAWLGALKDGKGNAIAIEGLWALKFGNGGNGGDPFALYFSAGISGGAGIEDHGLFGSISQSSGLIIGGFTKSGNNLVLTWSGGTPPYILQKKNSLSDATWTNVETLSSNTFTVPMDGAAGFFRVIMAPAQ